MPDYSGLLKETAPNIDPAKKPGAGLFADSGIYSPSEKLQMQLQQQQAQQAQFLLQQQIMAQQQGMQLASANAKSNAPTGYNFAPFLAMGGGANLNTADKLATQARGSGQPAQVPQIDSSSADQAGIDPGSILSQALQQYPNDKSTALRVAGKQIAGLGQQRGSSYLQNIGSNLLNEAYKADKEKADLEEKKANTGNLQQEALDKQGKRGNPGTPFNIRDPQGNMVPMAPSYNPDGSFKGWDQIAPGGPNKIINQTIDDPRTQTQKGEEYTGFQKLTTNTESTIYAMRDITENLKQGAAQGWAASTVGLLDNAAGTLAQLAPNSSLNAKATQALAGQRGTFANWAQKTGVNDSIWNDLVSNLAKTYNPTGTITEKDITRAAKTVGQSYSNPKTVAAILEDAERRARRFVDVTYDNMGDDARGASKSQYNRFVQKFTPGADDGDGSDQETPSIDQDNEPALPKGVTVTRRGKVKSGPNAGKSVRELSDGTKDYY